jgi:hypothetical protein
MQMICECGRPAKFKRYCGTVKQDSDHTLCFRCYDSFTEQSKQRRLVISENVTSVTCTSPELCYA